MTAGCERQPCRSLRGLLVMGVLLGIYGCTGWPRRSASSQPAAETTDSSANNSPFQHWFVPSSPQPASIEKGVGPPPEELQSRGIPRFELQVRVLLVRIPKSQRADAERVWTYLREDVLDAELHRRLRENGIRVGLTRREWWDSIRSVLDGVTGRMVQEPAPVRLPPGFPLSLDLDESARDQTLFYLNEDRVLTGRSWPESRNSLRLTATLDSGQRGRLRLEVCPEVKTRSSGFDWIQSLQGAAPSGRATGMLFQEASFYMPLTSDDILLLAPNEKADTFGIIGGAFLTDDTQGVAYDRYIFIRPDFGYDHGNRTSP